MNEYYAISLLSIKIVAEFIKKPNDNIKKYKKKDGRNRKHDYFSKSDTPHKIKIPLQNSKKSVFSPQNQ